MQRFDKMMAGQPAGRWAPTGARRPAMPPSDNASNLAMDDHSWLWLNEDMSDLRICIVCEKPRALAAVNQPKCPPEKALAGVKLHEMMLAFKPEEFGNPPKHPPGTGMPYLEVLMKLPAHGVLLASASRYWKARLLYWRHFKPHTIPTTALTTNTAAAAAVAAASAAGKGEPMKGKQAEGIKEMAAAAASEPVINTCVAKATPTVFLEWVDAPSHVQAVHALLQYVYTHKLPEEPALTLLIQMAMYAHRWGMDQALDACLHQAATFKSLTVKEINMLLCDSWPSVIMLHSSYPALFMNGTAALVKKFGRAQAVIAKPRVLQAFLGLSLRAVQLWAQQYSLTVDSENTVAVLFTHWWNANHRGRTQAWVAAASKVLTNSLRAGHLTTSFVMCTLERLPWFKPEPDAIAALKLLHGNDLYEQRNDVRNLMPADWTRPARDQEMDQAATLDWVVTKAQLDKLHRDAEQDAEATVCSGASLYWAGYNWRASLRLDSQSAELFFGVAYTSAVPPALNGGPSNPPLVPASFELTVIGQEGTGVESLEFHREWPMGRWACGSYSLLSVPATTEPRLNSYPPARFWADGKLHLQVTMKEVW